MRNQFTNPSLVRYGVDPADYHQQDIKRGDPRYVMSRSELCTFAACPSRWIHGYRFEETESTEWGDLMDCLVTDNARFESRFAIKPQFYLSDKGEEKKWTRAAKVCAAWEDEQGGKTLVKHEAMQEANSAVERLMKDPAIHSFLMCSKKQVMVTADWKDASGLVIPVKILVDLVPDPAHEMYGKCLGDFKTTRNAAPSKWTRAVSDLNYHAQAALYLDIYNAAKPEEDRVEFRHIIVENVKPFEPARRWLDAEMIDYGRAIYRNALSLYAQCLSMNKWPSWDDANNGLIPGWGQVSAEAWMVKQMPIALSNPSSEQTEQREVEDFQH